MILPATALAPDADMHSLSHLGLHARSFSSSAPAVIARAATPNTTSTTMGVKSANFASGLFGVDQTKNYLFVNVLLYCSIGLILATLAFRLTNMARNHLRHLTLMGTNSDQTYHSENHNGWWPWLKKHVLYAPLGRGRHNTELTLFKGHIKQCGTIPSRFHTILLLTYLAFNIAFCLVLPYGQPSGQVVAALRGRSGMLSVANLIPTMLFAMRNDPLINLLRVSYDTFNLLHRWCARLVVFEALVHVAAWAANTHAAGGEKAVEQALQHNPSYVWGMVGVICFGLIVVVAISPLRHAFYETFLAGHRTLVLVALIGVYVHLDLHHLPQLWYMQVVFLIWGLEYMARLGRILYFNWSPRRMTRITVEALPNDACRVTLDLVREWKGQAPGCHVHLYMPSVAWLSSHPFSIAWTENHPVHPPTAEIELKDTEKGVVSRRDEFDLDTLRAPQTTSVSLVCRAREGFTRHMYDRACAAPSRQFSTWGFMEGPYGGHESLDSYGTLLLFAAGVGITHQIMQTRHLVESYLKNTTGCKKVTLVWGVQKTEDLEWVRPWMDSILRLPGRKDILKIQIFVSKPRSHDETAQLNSRAKSTSLTVHSGRFNAQTVLDKEIVERVGAMAVTVCASGAVADGVRAAVRRRVDIANLDFVEEAFTY